MKKLVITLSVLVAAGLVVCLVPLKEVAYVVMVDYEATEPYQVEETYVEDVPLGYEANGYLRTDTIQERHRIVIGGVVFQDEIVEVEIQVACVGVTNTDDIAGSFLVSFSGIDPMFGETSLTTELEIQPGATRTAECPAESIDAWTYGVTPSTKAVEQQREVTRYRTVTRQREETRYKRITLLAFLLAGSS